MTGLRQAALFFDAEEAQVAAGYLRANDIDALLPDHNSLTAMPHYRVALGGYRVLVPSFDLEKAHDLLAKAEETAEEEAPHCWMCGGRKFAPVKTWFPSAILLLLIGLIFPFAKNTPNLQCVNCGSRLSREEAVKHPT